MPGYKWANPYEWLEYKSNMWGKNILRAELLELAQHTDFDTLQDMYQSEMDKDGYFEKEKNHESENRKTNTEEECRENSSSKRPGEG